MPALNVIDLKTVAMKAVLHDFFLLWAKSSDFHVPLS